MKGGGNSAYEQPKERKKDHEETTEEAVAKGDGQEETQSAPQEQAAAEPESSADSESSSQAQQEEESAPVIADESPDVPDPLDGIEELPGTDTLETVQGPGSNGTGQTVALKVEPGHLGQQPNVSWNCASQVMVTPQIKES